MKSRRQNRGKALCTNKSSSPPFFCLEKSFCLIPSLCAYFETRGRLKTTKSRQSHNRIPAFENPSLAVRRHSALWPLGGANRRAHFFHGDFWSVGLRDDGGVVDMDDESCWLCARAFA